MRIAVGNDHAAMEGPPPLFKPEIVRYLREQGHTVVDCGTNSPESVDYPDLAQAVCDTLLAGEADAGILMCGTGIGVCISANKVPGIRAALTHDTYSATRAVLSNNAQIITMGARVIGVELAKDIAGAFLRETFDEKGRSADNVQAINEVDAKYNR